MISAQCPDVSTLAHLGFELPPIIRQHSQFMHYLRIRGKQLETLPRNLDLRSR